MSTRETTGKNPISRIVVAESDTQIDGCFTVMAELRPHLTRESFLQQIKRQVEQGHFQLAYLENGAEVRAVAAFRIGENLAWGRYLYVDDLVTRASDRSHGYGAELFCWLTDYARGQGCDQLHLDSGVLRHGAHRFYLSNRMDITSFHFAMRLITTSPG